MGASLFANNVDKEKAQMFFYIKQPKIKVDFFTARADVFNNFKIEKSLMFAPSWWRELPRQANLPDSLPNMRRCAGFVEMYKQSYVLPMWNDLAIDVDQNKNMYWQFADNTSKVEFHDASQRGNFAPNDKYLQAKIISPWCAKTKQDVHWLMHSVIYDDINTDNYLVCPGLLNFKYQADTNIQIVIPNEVPRKFVIPHNKPLVHLVPLTEKKVEVVTHLVDQKELERLHMQRVSFVGSYYALKKLMVNKA